MKTKHAEALIELAETRQYDNVERIERQFDRRFEDLQEQVTELQTENYELRTRVDILEAAAEVETTELEPGSAL